MKEVKCLRCGTTISYKTKDTSKKIKCPHCQLELVIDQRTQRIDKYVRMTFVAIIVGALMFGLMNLGSVSSYIAVIIVCSIMLVLANFSDKICLIITDKLFGLRYNVYTKPDIKEINKAKKAKEKKKGK